MNPSADGNNGALPLEKGLVSIKDLDKARIEGILAESRKMMELCSRNERSDVLEGKIMASLFYEPSTRTRLSFESAMHRLGGDVIGFSDPASTSSMKGESLADTVRVVSAYSDIIVLRHPKEGAIHEALENTGVPLINAGDGTGQHPTQALYDLFTIWLEKKRLDGLNIALVGDLKYGRAIHSLAYGLGLFGNKLTLISPKELQMPEAITNELRSKGVEMEVSDSLDTALGVDAVYIPRIQKERFSDPKEYERFANYYIINKKFMEKARDDILIMSPLPRITEISPEIDGMKGAIYFKQSAYGIPVRMAILKMIMSKSS